MGGGNRKLSYRDFADNVQRMNEVTTRISDSSGQSLYCHIQPGAERSILWTRRVKILCGMRSAGDRSLENFHVFNFKQYMKLHSDVYHQLASGGAVDQGLTSRSLSVTSNDANVEEDIKGWVLVNIQNEITDQLGPPSERSITRSAAVNQQSTDLCCICCDRETDTVLPCTHRYCDQCITQWSTNCPQCRVELRQSTDTWHMLGKPANVTTGDLLSSVFQARVSCSNSPLQRSLEW